MDSLPSDLSQSSSQPWSWRLRFGFRFVFVWMAYVTIQRFTYLLPAPTSGPWRVPFVAWINAVSGWPFRFIPDYAQKHFACNTKTCWLWEILLIFLLSLTLAIVWTILDRKRTDYRKLHAWMRLTIRYVLAAVMFYYAWDKLVGDQFWNGKAPSTLVMPFGAWDSHEMMWSTMGISAIYAAFTGIGEGLGGLLILFRRTTTLGALLIIQIMAVVVMLDYTNTIGWLASLAWDYALMGLVLMAPDAYRLACVYLWNRPAPPVIPEPSLVPRELRWAKWPILLFMAYRMERRTPPGTVPFWFDPHPMTGMFAVVHPPGSPPPIADSTWTYIDFNGGGHYRGYIEPPGSMTIVRGDETEERRSVKVDSVEKRLLVSDTGSRVDTVAYKLDPNGDLHLEGRWTGKPMKLDLRRWEPEETTLYQSGYPASNKRVTRFNLFKRKVRKR